MNNTKEKILQTSLELFAAEGFEAVSVSDIAGALGITKGALYRHYTSKRAIFEAILHRMEQEDAQRAEAFQMPQDPGQGIEGFRFLADFCRGQFRYWTEDPFASRFRRMLTLEQYRSPEMSRLCQQYLGAGPLDYTKELLASLGAPQSEEAAAALYGTMFLLYSVYDGAEDKAAVTELLDQCVRRMEERMESSPWICGD